MENKNLQYELHTKRKYNNDNRKSRDTEMIHSDVTEGWLVTVVTRGTGVERKLNSYEMSTRKRNDINPSTFYRV